MSENNKEIQNRKKDHIDLCINEDVGFKTKNSGFDYYHFEHYTLTEINYSEIDITTKFFGHKIDYPFIISCMTGGTEEAKKINELLSITANNFKIPIGVGSQRQALEDDSQVDTYKIIRENAPETPVCSNIGAAQVARLEDISKIQRIIDLVRADALFIHINPAQELIQQNGEPNFGGLLRNIEKITKKIKIPVIAKEVGSGISRTAARKLLESGVRGIDVAGAGGTSWTAVEMLRNNDDNEECIWNWGIPTTYCLKEVRKLKKNHYFTLIASGGINSGENIAKSLALGADLAASARTVLKTVMNGGLDEVEKLLVKWFTTLKKIMYLTGCATIKDFTKIKLIKQEDLY